MGADDKTDNKLEEIARRGQGEGRQTRPATTSLQRQGERDQSKANLKQAGEKVKDAFK